MRLGEALGLRISDFFMGHGGTAHIEIVPRPGNPNGARVKMMRPRRVYVGAGLERLFADYLTHLACRAGGLGIAVTADWPLLVNLERPPLLAALGEGTVRDKVASLRRKGIGPPGWTPHWFRHSTPRPCCWRGPRTGWSPGGSAMPTSRPRWIFTAGSGKTKRCGPPRTGGHMRLPGR